MRRFGLLGAAALLGLAGCQRAETPQQVQARMDQESAAFKQYVDGVAQRWGAWVGAGQADSIANGFTEDGREMPPNAPAAVGRAAIKAAWEQFFGMGKWTITVRPEVSAANGPLGVDRGTYTTTFSANAGMQGTMMPPPADTGKYLIHWQKVNDSWQMAELIWNSDMPLPTPPQATGRR